MSYDSELLAAADFSAKQGLDLPAWVIALQAELRNGGDAPAPVIDETRADKIAVALNRFTGSPPRLEALVNQCLNVHRFLQDEIAGIIGARPVLTVGGVEQDDGYPLFGFSRKDFEEWSARGAPDISKMQIHAWLTLPSLEIIDLTFVASATVAMTGVYSWPYPVCGLLIAQRWQDFQGIVYSPVALGDNIPEKLRLPQVFIS
ncbi:MAG: hypothetical protein ACYDHM_02270 [Acidiferrobacterales bacterium]